MDEKDQELEQNEAENEDIINDAPAAEKEEGTQDIQEDEIAKLKNDLKIANDQYLRTLAEMDNVRKRAAREREEYVKFAALPLIKKLLTVLDDSERALNMYKPGQEAEVLIKGVEMINTRIKEIVEQEGAVTIDAAGKPFDPQYHQPLAVEQDSEYTENTVIEELQKGYIMHGRVIRPSLVKVSS